MGIRHQVQELPDGAWLTEPETLRGLRQLASAGLAFDLIVRADQIPACVAAARAVPELQLRAGPPGQAEDRGRRAGAVGL